MLGYLLSLDVNLAHAHLNPYTEINISREMHVGKHMMSLSFLTLVQYYPSDDWFSETFSMQSIKQLNNNNIATRFDHS